MLKRKGKLLILLSVLLAVSLLTSCGNGQLENQLNNQREITANYMMTTIESPALDSVGGDWAALGVAKSGIEMEEGYLDSYYDNVRAGVKGVDGILSNSRYTEYARVAIVLGALGYDPLNVEGYDLLQPLTSYEMVSQQEFNGPVYALIALKVNQYANVNETAYVEQILEIAENEPFYEGTSTEADYIGMLLQALSFYQGDSRVDENIEKCVNRLGEIQEDDGSFGSCESTAQAILGLVAVGEDPLKFSKEGTSVAEALLQYVSGEGFSHLKDGNLDQMSTEQALLALDAIYLMEKGETLYE